jgi:hypothetical protein
MKNSDLERLDKRLTNKLKKWLDENPDAPKEEIKKAKELLKNGLIKYKHYNKKELDAILEKLDYKNSERYKKNKKSTDAQAYGCLAVGLILVFILLKLMGAF